MGPVSDAEDEGHEEQGGERGKGRKEFVQEREGDDEEEGNRFPVIPISHEDEVRIRAHWKNALILKTFGKTVGFSFMNEKLRSIWNPQGRLELIDLGRDFFKTKLESNMDFEKALHGGPWFIGQQFLTIRLWEPEFKVEEASIMKSTAVWARLPSLLVEYYDKDILQRIASSLGKLHKVDGRTFRGERGRFARVCIMVDLDKPLVPKVRVGHVWQAVQYEGIGSVYFECGRIGHKKESCPGLIKPMATPLPPPVEEQDFGPWIMVERKKASKFKNQGRTLVKSQRRVEGVETERVTLGEVETSDKPKKSSDGSLINTFQKEGISTDIRSKRVTEEVTIQVNNDLGTSACVPTPNAINQCILPLEKHTADITSNHGKFLDHHSNTGNGGSRAGEVAPKSSVATMDTTSEDSAKRLQILAADEGKMGGQPQSKGNLALLSSSDLHPHGEPIAETFSTSPRNRLSNNTFQSFEVGTASIQNNRADHHGGGVPTSKPLNYGVLPIECAASVQDNQGRCTKNSGIAGSTGTGKGSCMRKVLSAARSGNNGTRSTIGTRASSAITGQENRNDSRQLQRPTRKGQPHSNC